MWSWLPWNRARIRRLLDTPLDAEQRAVLTRNMPLLERLDGAQRARLEGLIQVFLDEKAFEGLGGLELTDEIRLTIAAHACFLLVGLDVDVPYPGLDVVRVYPGGYRAEAVTRHESGAVSTRPSHRLGESSRRGYVVVTWRNVLESARSAHDGHNLVLHEFAHQLDTADGVADGAPVLASADRYGPWARVLGEAFEELQQDVAQRRRNVLDAYGATNPAEFFAVATETFFERPRALKRQEPDLYEVLARYYGQDPAGGGGMDLER